MRTEVSSVVAISEKTHEVRKVLYGFEWRRLTFFKVSGVL